MRLLVFVNVDWYCALHWKDRLFHWKRLGIDVHLATHFTDPTIKRDFESEGITCHAIALKRKSFSALNALAVLVAFRQLVKAFDPDVIHTITIKPNIFGGIIARLYQKPLLVSITGLGRTFDADAPLPFKLWRGVSNAVYRFISKAQTCRFVFENRQDRQDLVDAGVVPADRSLVVNGAGIDINIYHPQKREMGGRVLFASRLLWSKGLDDLIKAKRLAQNTSQDFELVVAGIVDQDAHDAIKLSYVQQAHAEGLITWLGQVEDMAGLINDCDIVALPSRYKEGIPRILIEAAACGKPLIANDIAGCNDIVIDGENGTLITGMNPTSLLNAIDEILSDREKYQSYSLSSRTLAEEKFSNTIIIEQYLSAFRDIYPGLD